MKITAPWIETPATQAVFAMLNQAGYAAYFVGGCVRNALLDVPVGDIDIATDARPDTVMDLAKKAELKTIPTGVEHGTVTVIADQIPFEITTFRTDLETHGRHATVAFSDDMTEDARRRDFTMNALYATADGTVSDPLGGLEDLLARRVRFIDDAGQRIREDYLRILRFFRFHACYGDPSGGLDAQGLAAVAEHTEGLAGLSQERVGSEMLKLLSASDPAPSVAAMRATGVLQKVLPGAEDRFLAPLVHFDTQLDCANRAIRRLACLGGEGPADRLRLSKKQARQLELLRSEMASTKKATELGYRFGLEAGLDIVLLRAALFQQKLPSGIEFDLKKGAMAKFPITANDLMPELSGPALGARLKDLEQHWINADFTMTKKELLTL